MGRACPWVIPSTTITFRDSGSPAVPRGCPSHHAGFRRVLASALQGASGACRWFAPSEPSSWSPFCARSNCLSSRGVHRSSLTGLLCGIGGLGSQKGNFPFWEIVAAVLPCCKSFDVAACMPKSRYTAQYERLLGALRQARQDAHLTQAQVAKHFGSHASFVSKIESGERRIDVVELAQFCRLYGVRLAVFLRHAGLE